MMKRSAIVALAGLVTLSLAAVPATSFAAATGPLQPSDAPPGFGKLHTKVYTSWAPTMHVTEKTKGFGGKGKGTCQNDAVYKADGWSRGVIQGFDSPNILAQFVLCEADFSSVAGAKKAYSWGATDFAKQSAKVKGMQPMTGVKVGDKAMGEFDLKGGLVSAELLWRHGSSVVILIYLGSSAYKGTTFVATANRADARIP
jgi:hypothetical protein